MMADTSDDSYLRVEHLQPETETQPISRSSCTARRVLFMTILILSLSANAAFLLYVHRHQFKDANSHDQAGQGSQSEVHIDTSCTGCTDIGVHPGMENIFDLEDLKVQTVSATSYLCCLKNVQGRQMLLNLFNDQANNALRCPQPCVDFVASHKSGAHLYLNLDATKKSRSLGWTDKSHCSASTSDDVNYDNNTLQIKQHVSVTASNMSYVYEYPSSNSFGLFYVGE